jgi:thymidylate kinase
MGGIVPDLTIYLVLDVDTAMKRSKKPFTYNERIKKYYKDILKVYDYLAQTNNNRIVKIDAKKPINKIHKTALEIILKQMGGS